jgi:hypothetical protein
MDKEFLNKVIDQIVYETMIDHEEEKIKFPFFSSPFSLPISPPTPPLLLILPFPTSHFSDHCKDVYGLNGHERDYVWNIYKHIIKDKIKNG